MAAKKKNTITLKFPTFEEAIKHKSFEKIDVNGVYFEDADELGYIDFPIEILGKTIVFDKDEDCDIYAQSGEKEDALEFNGSDELRLLHKIVKVVAGTPLELPIDIDGDDLTYNKEVGEFRCGCKVILLEQADEIFRFLGKHLGYTITQ